MNKLKERVQFYKGRIKAGRLKDLKKQTIWIYQYARNYWPQMIFYTVLGMGGTVLSIFSGFVSRDLVDIITGYRVGELVKTFSLMIGMAIGNILVKGRICRGQYRTAVNVYRAAETGRVGAERAFNGNNRSDFVTAALAQIDRAAETAARRRGI